MNTFFTQLKNTARTLKLSSDEKQRMRYALYDYIKAHPLEPAAAAPLRTSVPSPYFFFAPRFAMPLAAVLLIVLTSGTAFAAQGALPGDTLYPVKVKFTERVQLALATTPEAKAQVNADLAEARLEEAEVLAAKGALDASTSATLALNFTEHAQAVKENASTLEDKNPGAAADVGAAFSSALAAHSAILSEIGDTSKDEKIAQNSNVIAMAVRAHQDDGEDADSSEPVTIAAASMVTTEDAAPQARTMIAAKTAQVSTFAATAAPANEASTTSVLPRAKVAAQANAEPNPKDTARAQAVVASLQAQASSSIARAQSDFDSVKGKLDTAVSAEVEAQLDNARALFGSAIAAQAGGDLILAKQQLNATVRLTVKLHTYLKAGKKINLKLLSNLLGVSVNSASNSEDSGAVKGVESDAPKSEPKASVSGKNTGTTSVQSEDSHSGSGSVKSSSTNINVKNNVNVEVDL